MTNQKEKFVKVPIEWRRYRFKTYSIDDYRPIKFNPHFPWWCTGESFNEEYVIIVAYLPVAENLKDYWDDAFDIDSVETEDIEFSTRFIQPEWLLPFHQNAQEKVKLAKVLLVDAEVDMTKQRKIEISLHKCKCGHTRAKHGISYSINYTQGFCKDCDCQYFLSPNLKGDEES